MKLDKIIIAVGTALVLTSVAAAQPAPMPDPQPALHISDAQVSDWFKFRQSKFAELQAAHPNQAAEIAAVKAAAAAAFVAAEPLGAVDAPPVVWRVGAPIVIYDDPSAPRMAVVPAGEFTMGAPAGGPGHAADAAPRHRVRIADPFAVSLFPIVYGEYALFSMATHRPPSSPCQTIEAGRAALRQAPDWRNTGYPQTVRFPAVCISFADAAAYATWLSTKTGHVYRLLSEAEYDYVERAGTPTSSSEGSEANADCAITAGICNDGHHIAPVGSLKPNGFGLFDTAGNVTSWTADCWNASYAAAPTDGTANTHGDCRYRVIRGAAWTSTDRRVAHRDRAPVNDVSALRGFRLARIL